MSLTAPHKQNKILQLVHLCKYCSGSLIFIVYNTPTSVFRMCSILVRSRVVRGHFPVLSSATRCISSAESVTVHNALNFVHGESREGHLPGGPVLEPATGRQLANLKYSSSNDVSSAVEVKQNDIELYK